MITAIDERRRILDGELTRIVDLIVKGYLPEKIILFGSLAGGKVHEWSDIDLVIIKNTDKRFIDRLHEVHLMTKPKVGVNFVVYTSKEAQEMQRQNRYFFVKEILNKGEVLYERRK